MKGAVEAGRFFFFFAGFFGLPFGLGLAGGFADAVSVRFGSEKSGLFAMTVSGERVGRGGEDEGARVSFREL